MDQDLQTCPICKERLNGLPEALVEKLGKRFRCINCQTYEVSGFVDLDHLGADSAKRAILSHVVREMTSTGTPFLTSHLYDSILKRRLPTVAEQCQKLLIWLSSALEYPGRRDWVSGITHRAVIGAESSAGFEQVVLHLVKIGLIDRDVAGETHTGRANSFLVMLSVPGWAHVEELRRQNPNSRVAFMAMKYGDSDLDGLFAKTFLPAVSKTGFELRRLMDRPSAGLIDDRLRVEIRNARFILADLTHDNAGAYWEAGFAEGLGKPVIYTCESAKFHKKKTHFDTNHHLTITWSKDSPDKAAEDLKATIRATLPAEAKMTDD